MRTDKLAVCHVKSTPKTDTHCTPLAFFKAVEDYLDFKFTLDAAATPKNTLCKKYFTKKDNALERIWRGNIWCNPPYSKAYDFVRKGFIEGVAASPVVMLLAARTDTKWWHSFASKASHIIFIKGRLKFANAKAGAPFPSVLLIFGKIYVDKDLYWAPTPYERGFSRGKPKGKI